MKKELIVHEDPKSPISEIFRTLRTNIQFTYTKNKLKTILVTSTLPGEGKSWVSSNLAVTFAQAGKKVILVDADMRKGRQYSIFGVSPRPGLSNYLSGVDDNNNEEASEDILSYIQETSVENLYLISAGNIPPNPSELLISTQMENLINKLREMADIVIIDGTPSQLVTDSLILTRMVDSTVVVAASKKTKKEDLRRIIKNIQNIGGKIAGVVVNKVPISAKKYEQSYYYGSTAMTPVKPIKKRAKSDLYERASSIIETTEKKTDIEEVNNEKVKEKNSTEDLPKRDLSTNKEKTEELPKALNKKIKIENQDEISLEKTTNILNQINEYIEQEKKKLQ